MVEDEEAVIHPQVLQAALLHKIGKRLGDLTDIVKQQGNMVKQQIPEGIVEPVATVTATISRKTIRPPFVDTGKLWFGITIVKVSPVELNVVVNSGKSSDTPHTMEPDEKVFDQYFNTACIYDVTVWTNSGECIVKIRGSR